MLIAFCGIDGSGKTTQIKKLEDLLREKKYSVYCTKQPTNWYRSDERIRKILNQQSLGNNMMIKEAALFSAADRLRHIQTEIVPQENIGKIVISDRYVFSTYAYFVARGITDFEWLKEINKFAPKPDITFYIDVMPETALQRIIKRDGKTTKKEETDLKTLHKVRNVFLSQPWGKTENYYVIDGNKSEEDVAKSIRNLFGDFEGRIDKGI